MTDAIASIRSAAAFGGHDDSDALAGNRPVRTHGAGVGDDERRVDATERANLLVGRFHARAVALVRQDPRTHALTPRLTDLLTQHDSPLFGRAMTATRRSIPRCIAVPEPAPARRR